jgi:hypothetical protein
VGAEVTMTVEAWVMWLDGVCICRFEPMLMMFWKC